ncbi:MAG: hypothetical protein Q4A93_02420 [Actinomycetota bacterium]|nr:hypothetical protein [Actinomycetota bacterium]
MVDDISSVLGALDIRLGTIATGLDGEPESLKRILGGSVASQAVCDDCVSALCCEGVIKKTERE